MQVLLAQTNTYLGSYAGYKSNGSWNTMIGQESGIYNTGLNDGFTASGNTIIGASAGKYNRGSDNTIVGISAGNENVGEFNIFFGKSAGYHNKGSELISIGKSSAANNLGSKSIFIGTNAGTAHTGINNTAIGHNSGSYGITGSSNTFLGIFSGSKVSTGSNSVYIGMESGRDNRVGSNNTFLGMRSGMLSTGNNNVFIGYKAGYSTTTSNKLIIASESSNTVPLITGDFQAKHVAIGGDGDIQYTLHVLGTAFSSGNWVSSDRRYKTSERSIEKASDKIIALQGKSYEFKNDKNSSEAKLAFAEGKQYGFIAQEMRQILPELVREGTDGYLAINYDGVIPVLVEAFKELKSENQDLRNQLERLNQQFSETLHLKHSSSSVNSQSFSSDKKELEGSFTLSQNQSNPFNNSTEIPYEVTADGKAISLLIHDTVGALRLQYLQLQPGKGQVSIQAGSLPAGTYIYSLSVDGKIVDSRRMILAR